MPIKFEVGNISVVKFVSRTIVDNFLVHFMITITDWPYSDIFSIPDHKVIMYFFATNFHRQLGTKISSCISLQWWSAPFVPLLFCLQCYKLLPTVFNCLHFEIVGSTMIQSSWLSMYDYTVP